MARVVVAMSGGVDSSLAAALLCELGHEVIGVTMQLWPHLSPEEEQRRGGCCGFGAAADARAVADLLAIPYYVLNLRDAFRRHVIESFAAAYARGRTPNPCIACNEHIKFRALLDKARALDADFLATGHYARCFRDDGYGRHVLARAADPLKDQSYVLYPLAARDLPQILFPLGDRTKRETRDQARRLGLPVADKPDSYEICFVGEAGHAAVVAELHPEAARPGPVLDTAGRVVGRHRGLAAYTVGQRKGLGLTGRADGRPWYVLSLDAERNAVVVGGENELGAAGCIAAQPNWLAVDGLRAPLEVTAKVRSGSPAVPATLTPLIDGRVEVRFAAPVRAVTPGQAVVWYAGDVVLGGGAIEEVASA